MDWGLSVAGLVIGVVVGLTGMGGGALMTPVLVIFFHLQPLAAVSNDLVTSAVMKPFGGAVHARKGTVNTELVKWLILGSVPCAFAGVLIARALGPADRVQTIIQTAMGIALLVAVASLIGKAYLGMVARARRAADEPLPGKRTMPVVVVKPVLTVAIGAIGGLIVGITSVGSGSLIIVALLLTYPALKAGDLVGTDLVQAVPLVVSAAVAHLIFGDVQLDVTGALLIGSIPGVIIGSLVSSRAPGSIVRRALSLVLLASGLKLLGVSNLGLVIALIGAIAVGPPIWMLLRRRHGFTAIGGKPRPNLP